MKRVTLALLVATSCTAPSFAADMIMAADPAPVPVDLAMPVGFTGLYIGVQGGGAFNPDDPDNLQVNPSFGPTVPAGGAADAFGDSFSSEFDSSFIGGVHVGYDYQIENFVIGAVADINATDISIKQNAFSNTPAFYTAERSLDYLATARVRGGVMVTDRALAYATGGVAYGEVDYRFSTDSPAVSGNGRSLATARPASVSEDEDEWGYTVGGGLEVLLTDNVSFGAEYLYTNLGSSNSSTRLDGGPFDGSATNGGGTTGEFTDFESDDDFDFHTVTAKLSYRFN